MEFIPKIDVWVYPYTPLSYIPHAFLSILGKEETERCREYRKDDDRFRFLMSRILLRHALSTVSGVSPRDWKFTKSESGEWKQMGSGEQIQFSISHANGVIAVAVSRNFRVGIDIEPSNTSYPPLSDVYTDRELNWLESLSQEDRNKAQARLWTAKEAYSKLRGEGVELAFSSIEIYPKSPEGYFLESEEVRTGGNSYLLSVITETSSLVPEVKIHYIGFTELENLVA